MTSELIYFLALFVCGGVVGLLSYWGPISGWAALAFALVIPPFGFLLMAMFC
jgi:hypothetical protein